MWIPDPDKVWKAARLLQNLNPNSPTLRIITEDDQIVILNFFHNNKNPKLGFSLLLSNESDGIFDYRNQLNLKNDFLIMRR